MLVLARKETQSIVIERDGEVLAQIVVVSAAGPVRIGVDAPDDVLVLRGEVVERSRQYAVGSGQLLNLNPSFKGV